MNSIPMSREFDLIDDALRTESRARAVMVAIGEHWVQLQEMDFKPTEEELALHSHLVRHWRKAAHALNELLEQPIDRPRPD
jgi:hypothetical protein